MDKPRRFYGDVCQHPCRQAVEGKKGMPPTRTVWEGRQTVRTSTGRNDTPIRECVQSSCALSEFRVSPGWRFPRQAPTSETLITSSALLGPSRYSLKQRPQTNGRHDLKGCGNKSPCRSRKVEARGGAGRSRNNNRPHVRTFLRFQNHTAEPALYGIAELVQQESRRNPQCRFIRHRPTWPRLFHVGIPAL